MHVILETERLILRRFTTDDVDNLVELDGDPDVMLYINGGRVTSHEEIATDYLPAFLGVLRPGNRLRVLGRDREVDRRLPRMVPLPPRQDRPHDEPELGYRFRKSAWGKGYASEGSIALIDRGFTELDVRRVVAWTMVVNTGSRRVMEKAGMRLIRTFHQEWPDRIPGDDQGDVEYAITREEWEQLQARPTQP